MAIEREVFYSCEVKRRRVRAGGGYEPFWKLKTIVEALEDNDTEFRCSTCGGPVKVVKSRALSGPGVHIQHLHKADSEFCAVGLHFLRSTDGRTARMSENPVS